MSWAGLIGFENACGSFVITRSIASERYMLSLRF